jgi:hypothetical protein
MTIIIKIYQNKLISGVLAASCFREVKSGINSTLAGLVSQDTPYENLLILVDSTLKELRSLNQTKLSYDQHANIISAKVLLKELQLQMMNVIN